MTNTLTPHDTAKALRAGVDYLDAIHLDGDYAYYAAETGRWYLVSRDEIVDLGRRLLAHDQDAYSFWCADHGGYEVGDLDHDTLDRIAQAGGSPVAYRCQCGEVIGVRCAWTGDRADTALIEWMPEYLREDVRTAMNYGQYPYNGARRLRVERSCAARIIAYDPKWAFIVEDAGKDDDGDTWRVELQELTPLQGGEMAAQQTKTGHTPGPWQDKVDERFNPDRATAIVTPLSDTDCDAAGIDRGTGYEVIAEIMSGPRAAADARLIAAAPKMLELLRKRVQPFCPVSVQDDIRAILARIDGEEGDDHA